jgi:hypothetical protein
VGHYLHSNCQEEIRVEDTKRFPNVEKRRRYPKKEEEEEGKEMKRRRRIAFEKCSTLSEVVNYSSVLASAESQ